MSNQILLFKLYICVKILLFKNLCKTHNDACIQQVVQRGILGFVIILIANINTKAITHFTMSELQLKNEDISLY